MRRRRTKRVVLEGTIAAAGFASGDRFVVGRWERGPLGPMTDVMWQRPDGERVLLAPDEEVARFVSGIYEFEEIDIADFEVASNREQLFLTAGPLTLQMTAGPRRWLFSLRPKALRRRPAWLRFEDFTLRPLASRYLLHGAANVRVHGTSSSGVRQWYSVDEYRPMTAARASLTGRDLGDLQALEPTVTFGFSAFPSRPAFVRCATLLEGAEAFLPA